jgi:hypothetical protein
MPNLTCTRVTTEAELREWLDFPATLYPTGKYVPATRQHIISLFRGKTPYNRDGSIVFVLMRDATGRVVARTTIHESAKFDAKLEQNIQLFGFTEFVNDYEVFKFLLDFVTQVARDNHKTLVFGPANLLPNQSGGVIHSGFDERSFVDGVYNHAYYPQFYQRYGFEETIRSNTYICCDLTNPHLNPDELFPFDDARLVSENLKLHTGSRRHFAQQLPLLHKILNDSFSTLGYFTNIALDELQYQVEGLDFLLEEKLLLYLTRDDVPVAFVLCIPDVTDFIMAIGGNLSLLNQIRLFFQKSRYKQEAVLIIKGTQPQAWGQGYMNLVSRELLRNMQTLGYHTLRTTWVEDSNPGSANQFIKMSGKPLQRVTFYRMAVHE